MNSSKGQLLSSPIHLTTSRTSGMVHRVSLRTTNKEKLVNLTTRLVLEKAVTHKEFTTTDEGIHVSVFEFEERSVVFDLVNELDDEVSWNYELVSSATGNNYDSQRSNNKPSDHQANLSTSQKQTKSLSLEKNGTYQFPAKPTFKSFPNSPPTTKTNDNKSTTTPRAVDSIGKPTSPPYHHSADLSRRSNENRSATSTLDSVVRFSSPPHHSTDFPRRNNDNRSNTTPRTIDSVIPPRHSTEPSRRNNDNRSTTIPRSVDSVIRTSTPPRHHSTNLSNRIDSLLRPSSPPHHTRNLSSRIGGRKLVPDETQRSTMEEHISSRNGHNKRKSVHLGDQDYDRIKIPKEETNSSRTTTNEATSLSPQQTIPIERKEITSVPVSRIQSNQNIVIKRPEQEPASIGDDWMFYYKILLIRNEPHNQTSGPFHLHIHGYTFRVLFEVVPLKCKVTIYYEGCSNVVVSVMKTILTAISALPGQDNQCVPSKDPDKHATISPETPRHEQIGSFEFPMVWKLREKRLFYILMKIS